MKLSIRQAFEVTYLYLFEDLNVGDSSWEVSDVLSLSDTDERKTIHSGGPTADPVVWQDWKICVEKILEDNKIVHEDHGIKLTREQALKTMCCFLQKRYWEKKHNMLLREAVLDLQKYLTGNIPLEKTEPWRQWVECANDSLSFKEIFE